MEVTPIQLYFFCMAIGGAVISVIGLLTFGSLLYDHIENFVRSYIYRNSGAMQVAKKHVRIGDEYVYFNTSMMEKQ